MSTVKLLWSDVIRNTNMKLILFTVSIFVFGCSAGRSTSVEDQLQRMQLQVDKLKRSNEESIAAVKHTYDEKIIAYDEKLSSLEEQVKGGKCLVPQTGPVYLPSFYSKN